MRKTVATIVFSAFALMVGGVLAHAQTVVKGDIPFPFSVSGKSFAAGSYQFDFNLEGQVTVRSLAPGGKVEVASYLTRLSPRPGNEYELVFDQEGENYYLTEVYLPGHDGFYLKGAPGKHTHKSVKVGK